MDKLNHILENGNVNELVFLRVSVSDDNKQDLIIIDEVNNIKKEYLQYYDTLIEFAINYNKYDIINRLIAIDYPFSESEKKLINDNELKHQNKNNNKNNNKNSKQKYGFREDYFDVLMSMHH
jgi:hypothetical protein